MQLHYQSVCNATVEPLQQKVDELNEIISNQYETLKREHAALINQGILDKQVSEMTIAQNTAMITQLKEELGLRTEENKLLTRNEITLKNELHVCNQ